jgi:ubiquitin C-terminal hydrolase
LAGLENLGNTCYMCAPLQCLLRTPYFGDFLESFDFNKSNKNLLTYQLYDIYEQSKKSRDCIYMKDFKKKID